MTSRSSADPRRLALVALVLALLVTGAACSLRGGDAGDQASASPSAAAATPTRPAPMRIVTPTPVPAGATIPPDATAPPQNPQTYVVAEGDTLYGIALKFDVELSALIELNGLSDPNDIVVGQELQIPPR